MTHLAKDYDFFPVIITEFLVILIINEVTITAFARSRHLRKRSTYLIINLTVADLLVGAVTGPLHVYHKMKENFGFTWPGMIVHVFDITCLVGKYFYFKIIIGSWVVSFLMAALMAGLYLNEPYATYSYLWTSFSILTLLVLVVSYIIIIINVQSSPHSQNHGSIQTERKLSVTLFIVTGVSILTILPWTIYDAMPEDIKTKWGNDSSFEIYEVLDVIY